VTPLFFPFSLPNPPPPQERPPFSLMHLPFFVFERAVITKREALFLHGFFSFSPQDHNKIFSYIKSRTGLPPPPSFLSLRDVRATNFFSLPLKLLVATPPFPLSFFFFLFSDVECIDAPSHLRKKIFGNSDLFWLL